MPGIRVVEVEVRTLAERTLEADINARRILGNARATEEAGQTKRAARLYDAAQKALDRWNELQEREYVSRGRKPVPLGL